MWWKFFFRSVNNPSKFGIFKYTLTNLTSLCKPATGMYSFGHEYSFLFIFGIHFIFKL